MWSSTFSIITEAGEISEINGFDKCLTIKGVHKGFMTSKVGDTITQMTNCAQRSNYFICVGNSLEELKRIEEEIVDTLTIKMIKKNVTL